MRNSYWLESVKAALEAVVLVATPEQLKEIAESIRVSAEMEDEMASYGRPSSGDLENVRFCAAADRHKSELAEAQSIADGYRAGFARLVGCRPDSLVLQNNGSVVRR